jgi:hypothetical protein
MRYGWLSDFYVGLYMIGGLSNKEKVCKYSETFLWNRALF